MCYLKRARDEDIQIRVAAGEPLTAESFVLRALSSCARALPADAEEWDVSGLLYEGEPFSRETVACWLQCGYRHIYGATAELDSDSISVLSTVTGLAQVLAFANAVGSFEGMLQAACSQLQQLKFVVQLPEQVLEVPVDGSIYWVHKKRLRHANLSTAGRIGERLASDEQGRDVQQQVAKQAAALLQVAHVLRLQPLLDMLQQFILINAFEHQLQTRLLSGVMDLVFTEEVCEAAMGSSTFSKEAYVSSVMSQPCSLTPGAVGHSSLLKPVGPKKFDTQKEMLVFQAELLRDFAGGRAGDKVGVALDLFGNAFDEGVIQLLNAEASSWVALPVQLLLGHNASDAAALQKLLKPNAAE